MYWGKANLSENWGCCYLFKGGGYLPVTILGIIRGLINGDMNWPHWDHQRNFISVSSGLTEEKFKKKYEYAVLPANILDMTGLAPPVVSDPTVSHSTIR